MKKKWIKLSSRQRRRVLIRKKISGSAGRPRLSIFRSASHFYVQAIDDSTGRTIVSLSTISPALSDKIARNAGNVKGAILLGGVFAEECKKNGVTKVVFDRSGYLYHGRVKAFAESARKGGLVF